MNAAKIRVLVVEDSPTVRHKIIEVLSQADGFVVIGEAADGKTAIELCERLRPDVVTMDMMLPVMTGVAATEYIMAYCPTPILIVSASTNRGELFRTYDALAAGAVDVLEKALGTEPEGDWERRFLAAVRMVARIRVITHPRARLGLRASPMPAAIPSGPVAVRARPRLVAIGASTGGPSALLRILGALPASYPLPILVVIHIGEPFGRALTDWLDAQIPLPVRYAAEGELLPPFGRSGVLLAPPGHHLELQGKRLRLTDGPERHACRPSVDVLFESVAREAGTGTVACLLTGMGGDGATGLLAIQRSGGLTLAQDEATSIVFGMPGAAVKLGAADRIVPLGEFAGILLALAQAAIEEERK